MRAEACTYAVAKVAPYRATCVLQANLQYVEFSSMLSVHDGFMYTPVVPWVRQVLS